MTFEKFIDALTKFLTAEVGKDWDFSFEHDSGALFVKLTIPEEALDWGEED